MLKRRKNEPMLMSTQISDECILLYSYNEIKTFLEVAYKFNTIDIKSMMMDGQKVFIIKFENYDECVQLITEAPQLADASPTLLGCIPLDLVQMNDETLESMRGYLQHIENEDARAMLSSRNESYQPVHSSYK